MHRRKSSDELTSVAPVKSVVGTSAGLRTLNRVSVPSGGVVEFKRVS